MRIAFSHCGKVRRFTEINSEVDNEPQTVFINMARNNPNDEFIFFGASPDSKVTKKLFPNGNVKLVTYNNKHIDKFIKEGPVDLLVLYTGISNPGINIHDVMINAEGTGRQAVTYLMVKRYIGPILKYINHYNQKFIAFSNDPRHCTLPAKDLFVRPLAHYAQSEWKETKRRYTSYDDRAEIEYESTASYFPLERVRLIDKIKPTELLDKRGIFGIICNQGADNSAIKGVNNRWPILKNWLLDATSEQFEVYGQWSDEILRQDERMKGRVDRHILAERVKDWKYSLCIPIADGWNTGKYCELIEHQIVPFLYPGYDSFKLVNFPEILRLEKPSDLWERIEYLENNPEEYQKLMWQLIDLVYDEKWITGEKLNNLIYSHLTANYEFNYVEPTCRKWSDYYQHKVLEF